MIVSNEKGKAPEMNPNRFLQVDQMPDETGAQAMARMLLEPELRHALSASALARKAIQTNADDPETMDLLDGVRATSSAAKRGDLKMVSRLLASQALTLDTMFTEMARRAATTMDHYLDASEMYGRLALKAQANSRATQEALAKIHQPREQTVRHVHVNEGGQAVVADEFHHHQREGKSVGSDEQSHVTGGVGASAALLGENAQGDSVSGTSRERPQTVQDARGNQSRGT